MVKTLFIAVLSTLTGSKFIQHANVKKIKQRFLGKNQS